MYDRAQWRPIQPSALHIDELYKYRLARLGQHLSQKLAHALRQPIAKKDSGPPTVEDLLNYLPMRYEDRSHPSRISDLTDGKEASLELVVKNAGGYEVRNQRSYGRSRLFIFEVIANDPDRTRQDVVVWWFISGAHAYDIVDYYKKRLAHGARFMTFGQWVLDKRRATFSLRLQARRSNWRCYLLRRK